MFASLGGMSIVPEVASLHRATTLGFVVSVVVLEVGLRATTRRRMNALLAVLGAVVCVQAVCWVNYVRFKISMAESERFVILGPSPVALFWWEYGTQILLSLTPLLAMRLLFWKRAGLP
jgi:hypothetical protein